MSISVDRIQFTACGLAKDGRKLQCGCGTSVWLCSQPSLMDNRHRQSHGIVMMPKGFWCDTCGQVVQIVEGHGTYYLLSNVYNNMLHYLCTEKDGFRWAVAKAKAHQNASK